MENDILIKESRRAEARLRVTTLLIQRGFKVSLSEDRRYTLLLNGKHRVVFKVAHAIRLANSPDNNSLWWKFNLAASLVPQDEDQIDGYILRLDGIPEVPGSVYLYKAAPIRAKTLSISLRTLIHTYSEWARDFKNLSPVSLGLTKARQPRSLL